MNFTRKNLLLYAVTDRKCLKNKSLHEQVEKALQGGVTCLQLREKQLAPDEFLQEAKRMKKICEKYNIPLIINDNVDIAVKSHADGVHVGRSDMPIEKIRVLNAKDFIIGATVKTVPEAIAAEAAGANYLGAGAAFASHTKSDSAVISHEILQKISQSVQIPVIAIGGINKQNIHQLKGLGLAGVAMASAIFAEDELDIECKKLIALAKQMFMGI